MCDMVACDRNRISYQPIDDGPTTEGQTVRCRPSTNTICITPRLTDGSTVTPSPTATPSATPSGLCPSIDRPLINEFAELSPGSLIEIRGIPNRAFIGYVVLIGASLSGTEQGQVQHSQLVESAFDSNGLLTQTLGTDDLPPFFVGTTTLSSTIVLSSSFDTTVTSVDRDQNGQVDDPSIFGTVYDAIGSPTMSSILYGGNLGGIDFPYNPSSEFVFRDSCRLQMFTVTLSDFIYVPGGQLVNSASFVGASPQAPTFGSVNPLFST